MTKARTLADFVSSGSPLADGTISVAEVVGAAPLANPTFTGGIDVTGNASMTGAGSSPALLSMSDSAGRNLSLESPSASQEAELQTTTNHDLYLTAGNNSTNRLILRTDGTGERLRLSSSEAVFNEGSANTDFRVESDGNTHALFVDAGQNAVTINGSTVATDGSNNYPLSVRANTAADAIAVVGRTNDDIGELGFYESDGTTQLGNVQARVGSMRHRMLSNGGAMMFECNDSGGNLRTRQALYGSEAVFNDGSLDYDFRVESDGNANMLFVDAGNNRVGVGTNAPETAFNVVGHTRITGPIDSDAASTGYAASGAYATISGLPCYEGIIYQYVARSNLSPTNVAMAMGYAMGRGGNTFTFSNVLTAGRITMSSGANGDITITNSHSGSATCAFRVLRVL